jgi:hypothetical protein
MGTKLIRAMGDRAAGIVPKVSVNSSVAGRGCGCWQEAEVLSVVGMHCGSWLLGWRGTTPCRGSLGGLPQWVLPGKEFFRMLHQTRSMSLYGGVQDVMADTSAAERQTRHSCPKGKGCRGHSNVSQGSSGCSQCAISLIETVVTGVMFCAIPSHIETFTHFHILS